MGTPEKPVVAMPANPNQKEEPIALHVRLLKFLFGHVGMFLLVSFVAAFGAWIFMMLENPYEDQAFGLRKIKVQDMVDGQEYFTSFWWHYATQENLTFIEWSKKIKTHLNIMESFVLDMSNNYGYDGTKDNWTYEWNFANALLFTVSIMTTIGYGHIAPKTVGGQMFTIAYAMIGTPLLLVFLANIGDGMGKAFTFTYSRFCCRWCRSTRYQELRKPGKRAKRVSEDVVGKEGYMPTSEVHVPITINLVLIGLYLGLGAMIFSKWEQWDVASAYYFSFVTLSTIGFGDMVPGNSFMDKTGDDSIVMAFKMGTTIGYCLIGMALISMCIQIMQEQTIAKVRWVGQELGLLSSKDKPQKLTMRRTRRDAVPETSYLDEGYHGRPVTSEKRRRRRKREEAEVTEVKEAEPRRDSRSPSPSRDRRSPSPKKNDTRSSSPRRSPSPKRTRSPPPPQPPQKQEPDLMLDSDDDLFNLA